MSIIKKLRERSEPLNVGDLARLLNVTGGHGFKVGAKAANPGHPSRGHHPV